VNLDPKFWIQEKPLFLQWLFVNAVYLIILALAWIFYNGHIQAIGLIAIGAVLALYVCASGYAGYLTWNENRWGIHHISLAIELAPKLAMLGTVGGFLIAFSAGAGDVQHRVLGASTGLAATFVGISTMIVLEILRHIVEDKV
jgi:hypothetical protein